MGASECGQNFIFLRFIKARIKTDDAGRYPVGCAGVCGRSSSMGKALYFTIFYYTLYDIVYCRARIVYSTVQQGIYTDRCQVVSNKKKNSANLIACRQKRVTACHGNKRAPFSHTSFLLCSQKISCFCLAPPHLTLLLQEARKPALPLKRRRHPKPVPPTQSAPTPSTHRPPQPAMAAPPMAAPSVPSPARFRDETNAYLRHLTRAHGAALSSGDDLAVRGASAAADVARRAHAVHGAVHRLFLGDDGPVRAARVGVCFGEAGGYLVGLLGRMFAALRERDGARLEALVRAGEETLENVASGGEGAFEEVGEVDGRLREKAVGVGGGEAEGERRVRVGGGDGVGGEGNVDDVEGVPTAEDVEMARKGAAAEGRRRRFWAFGRKGKAVGDGDGMAGGAYAEKPAQRRRKRPGICGIAFEDMSKTQKVTICIYVLMVLASLVATVIITKDFVEDRRDPPAVLQIEVRDALDAPVITVCTATRGLPLSRLQFFNYTTFDGDVYVGADPTGPQLERQSPEFEANIERFFDNPDGEDCNAVVGDFFPLPLASLNDIAAGRSKSRCRPCYRVGTRGDQEQVFNTAFEASANMQFFTDSYFQQCLHVQDGMTQKSIDFIAEGIAEDKKEIRTNIEKLGLLTIAGGDKLDTLKTADFGRLTSGQMCSLMFFSFFPRQLGRADESVDIRYEYDGSTAWKAIGSGPYFTPPTQSSSFLPTESLEFFASTRDGTESGELPESALSDVTLIGPNSQSFVRLRPLTVLSRKRFDLTASSSNFLEETITPLFGYWRLYSVFYNFPRLIEDEIVKRPTYPAEQWLVDFLGYFGMFTGLSFFSLLLVPVLSSIRRNRRRRLKEERPEAFVWSQYRRLADWRVTDHVDGEDGDGKGSRGGKARNLLLP